ncbi:hypothetical protein EVAR_96952_1 [Eumeta japonica]|uniref:Uncharacterized protein n=1 Tax=Eumeta variegata TaxID=151549 RepID=A0A4C1VEC5_EUMVA|nr:hypothetical protein EVAR_96952_1 [Eumeta japonica]
MDVEGEHWHSLTPYGTPVGIRLGFIKIGIVTCSGTESGMRSRIMSQNRGQNLKQDRIKIKCGTGFSIKRMIVNEVIIPLINYRDQE